MTDTNYPSSIDPSNRGDFPSTIKFVLTKFLQGIDDMLPAKVIAYDRTTNRARVQPLISIVTTLNTQLSRAQIASIPVLQLGGGGFVLSFPINTGDIGWIKANDRDISLFLQSMTETQPNTQRKHSFEDAIFIPDTMFSNVSIAEGDEDKVCLQSLDASTKITLGSNIVEIEATMIKLTGDITSSGNLTVDGDIISKGGVGTSVSLHDHTHGGVQSGGSNTAVPNTT